MDLAIDTSTESSGRALLTLTGALDLESRVRLIARSQEVLASGPTAIVLGMAGVSFIDSTGLGAVVEIARSADDLGATFAISDPSDRVVRLLGLTGLDQEWTVE